ncbi:MAG: DNA glycosylase AlkZ-like family protein [Promethearchaeota archaeon]
MSIEIPRISRSQLQKVAIVGCQLHQFKGKGKTGIKNLIREQAMIQLDPLNPAGRNHDIFCFSRLNTYSQGTFEDILYPEALVFENYFHVLNVISRDYLPLFYPLRNYENAGSYYQKRLDNLKRAHPDLLDKVFSYIKSHGPVSSGNLVQFGKATPDMKIWKSSSKAGGALEFLWVLGKLAIVKRDQLFKKYYDLIERRFDSELLQPHSLSQQDLAYTQIQMRLRSFPLFNAKFTIKKSGTIGVPRSKKTWFHRMDRNIEEFFEGSPSNSPDITWGLKKLPKLQLYPRLVFCSETNRVYFIRHDWKDLLDKEIDEAMRAIAPLDPLIYDRNQTLALFDFDYLWEVYKPIKDRRWGYYIYPLLWKGKFVGRWEVKFDKKAKILRFFNFQAENKDYKTSDFIKAMNALILKWKNMIGATNVEYDDTIPVKH